MKQEKNPQYNLMVLRKKANLTQVEMAAMLSISEKAYQMKERGESPFYDHEMFLLSYYFDKPIEEIFLPRNVRNRDKGEVEKID